MSSQVKKRFAEMAAYLGRDTKGLEQLRLLKDDVNVLRKNLAAATQLADDEAQVKIAARERADIAEAALAQAQLEIHSLRQQLTSASNALCSIIAATADDTDENENENENEYGEVDGYTVQEADARVMVRSLRKALRYCPTPRDKVTMFPEAVDRFCWSDIVTGLSHKSLWTLGAAVAALTLLRGQVVIYSTETTVTMNVKRGQSAFLRNLCEWYSCKNDAVDVDAVIKRHLATTVSNIKPYHAVD